MKSFIGEKESGRSLVLFSIPPAFISVIGNVSTSLANGAVINLIFSFLIFFLLLIPFSMYFNKGFNSDIVTISETAFGKIVTKIIIMVFASLLFFVSSSSLSIFSNNISSLSSFNINSKSISFLIILSSLICAANGLEALTRKSYIIFILSCSIIFALVLISSKGINKDNIYPIFGTGIKKSFQNFSFLSLGIGLAPLMVIYDSIKKTKRFKSSMLSSFFLVLALVCIMLILYLLTVPYSMGKLYPTSLEAIFSSASSGEIMHRFELILLSLFVFLSIESTSLSVYCISHLVSKISDMNDIKPICQSVTPILYFTSSVNFSSSTYIYLCISLTLFCVAYASLLSIFGKEKV